jgi:hypothetical protein
LDEQAHDPSEAGMKASTQRVLRAICNIYGLMLLAYPDDFRSKYGREMLLALRNRAHDVLEGGSGSDLFAFVVHVSGDWVITALKENAMTGTLVSRLRWIAALPLAIVAADAAPRLSGYFIQDIRQAWIVAYFIAFFMAAVFITVGVCVVPTRRDAVARIALAVVVVLALILMTIGALNRASPAFLLGACGLLGGGLAYLPWRLHSSKPARE